MLRKYANKRQKLEPDGQTIFEGELIVAERKGEHGRMEYLLKYMGYPTSEALWQVSDDIGSYFLDQWRKEKRSLMDLDEIDSDDDEEDEETEENDDDVGENIVVSTSKKMSEPSPSNEGEAMDVDQDEVVADDGGDQHTRNVDPHTDSEDEGDSDDALQGDADENMMDYEQDARWDPAAQDTDFVDDTFQQNSPKNDNDIRDKEAGQDWSDSQDDAEIFEGAQGTQFVPTTQPTQPAQAPPTDTNTDDDVRPRDGKCKYAEHQYIVDLTDEVEGEWFRQDIGWKRPDYLNEPGPVPTITDVLQHDLERHFGIPVAQTEQAVYGRVKGMDDWIPENLM